MQLYKDMAQFKLSSDALMWDWYTMCLLNSCCFHFLSLPSVSPPPALFLLSCGAAGEGEVHHGPHQRCWALAEIPRPSGQHLQQSADWCSQHWERRRQQGQEPADWRVWRCAWCGSSLQGKWRGRCLLIIGVICVCCIDLNGIRTLNYQFIRNTMETNLS